MDSSVSGRVVLIDEDLSSQLVTKKSSWQSADVLIHTNVKHKGHRLYNTVNIIILFMLQMWTKY